MTEFDPATIEALIEVENHNLKGQSEAQLVSYLLADSKDWAEGYKEMVVNAYELGKDLHKNDQHRGMPYVFHLLRNASRAKAYLHCNDPEVLAAILLHDAVEDHSPEIVAISGVSDDELEKMDDTLKQQAAFTYFADRFSARVATVAEAVTNKPTTDTRLSYDEKLVVYAKKVQQAVITPEGWIAKYVDWIDNGVGIVHSDLDDATRMQHFALKYGLVLPIFEQRFNDADIRQLLDTSAKAYVKSQFTLARQRLTQP